MTASGIPVDRLPPDPLAVVEGPWSFELRGDEVADVRHDGVALLRAIRPVARDQDWRTLTASVVDRRVERRAGGWSVRLRLDFRLDLRLGLALPDAPVLLDADLVVGVAGDELAVTFTATARSDFRRNRIGLVLLHPLSEAGQPVEALHTDGSVESARWPVTTSPHQPLRDLRGLRWERDGVRAALALEGDVFETEDQRNWTDASFKTYSTPLDVPFPVLVRAGDQVHQAVRLSAARVRPAQAPASASPAAPDTIVVCDELRGVVPALSLGAGTHGDPVPSWAAGTVGFETVLVELTGPATGWHAALASADREARALGARLDVRLVVAGPEDVHAALGVLERAVPDATRVARMGVFDAADHVTTQPLWAALVAGTRERGTEAVLVAGARSHFAELNRRFADLPGDAQALTCSLTPQMHATELPHLVDSLAGQDAVRRDAARLGGDRPLHLGPVTLRQRFNAVATSSGDGGPPAPDPLQPTIFTAAWTLGSVAALTGTAVAGLCYYEVSGPGGIGDADGLHPVGRVLACLAGLRGRPVHAARVPHGVAAYPVQTDEGVRVHLARLGNTREEYVVHGPGGDRASVVLEPWSTAEVVLPCEAG